MVQVIAHRGARSLAPENTLAAAQLAFNCGADVWETDVRITRDGQLILCHDETLVRCTNVRSRFPSRALNPVNAFSLSEILSLEAGSYFEKSDPFGQIALGNISTKQLECYRQEHIPTLEQGLIFIQKNNWKVNLELKAAVGQTKEFALPEKVLASIRQIKLSSTRVVISSFYHPWLDWISKYQPQIEVQALIGENHKGPLDFDDFRFSTYNVSAKLITREQIADLKTRGKKINLFTVNDPKKFNTFSKMGVDGIFTDFPQRFAAHN